MSGCVVFLTSVAEVDVFLCLEGVKGGVGGGEIQAASLSCVQQKRATGQLCFPSEPRTTATSTSTLILAIIRRNKKISHRLLLTSVEEGAAFWSKMLQKYTICDEFVTRSNFFFFFLLGN